MNSFATCALKFLARFIPVSTAKTVAVITGFMFVWFLVTGINSWRDQRKITAVAKSSEIALDNSTLAARAIEMEESAGVATNPTEAKLILTTLLEEAQSIVAPKRPTTMTVKKYFSDVGQLIGKYFLFRESTTLSEGLIKQSLDCDLRSILYHTIATQAGLDVGIIYTPGHAFIGWQAPPNEVSVYWETTSQYGHAASITRSVYRDSDDPADYKLRSQAESEALYASWIYSKAYEQNREQENFDKVMSIARTYPDWHYPQVAKLFTLKDAYGIEDARTSAQLQAYMNLNGEDPFGKRLLMHQYKAGGKFDKALQVFSTIQKSQRTPLDYTIARQTTDDSWSWLKLGIIGIGFDALSKIKSVFGKKLTWLEYSFYVVLVVTFSILWIVMPYLWRFIQASGKNEERHA